MLGQDHMNSAVICYMQDVGFETDIASWSALSGTGEGVTALETRRVGMIETPKASNK